MRSRFDGRRPEVSSQRYDEIVYKDSFDKPFRISSKPYPVPLEPEQVDEDDHIRDDHECREYYANTRRDRTVRMRRALEDERDESFYTTTQSTSSPSYQSSKRHSAPRRQKIVDFPNRDWSYVEYTTSPKTNEYCGGYDYHDDVDSIDSLEAQRRRQDRTARARKDSQTRCPLVSSLRKEPRYGNPRSHPSILSLSSRVSFARRPQNEESHSYVDRRRFSMDGYAHSMDRHDKSTRRRVGISDHNTTTNKSDSNRLGSRLDPYRAPNYKNRMTNHHQPPRHSHLFDVYLDDSSTSCEDLEWGERCHSSSCSEEDFGNGIRFVRGMPIFSENPQLLNAKSVPELPPGYLRRKDGVVISVPSSSQGRYDKYGECGRDEDENSAEEKAQLVVEELRNMGYRIDDQNGILGSNSDSGVFSEFGGPPSRALHDCAVNSSVSSGGQSPPCVPVGKVDKTNVDSNEASIGLQDSLKSRASSPSSHARRWKNGNTAGTQPKASLVRLQPDFCTWNASKNGASSGASTNMADGSTITSIPTSLDGKQAEIFFELDDPSWQDSPVHVGRPQSTRNEDHVPTEIITSIPNRIPMAVSEVSHCQSVGIRSRVEQSVVHAFREEMQVYPINPLNNLCDRLILTCHIAAFPILKRKDDQIRL